MTTCEEEQRLTWAVKGKPLPLALAQIRAF